MHVFSLDTYNDAVVDMKGNRTLALEAATQKLVWESKLKAEDSIITEVTWVANSSLVLKEVARSADSGNVVYFDFGSITKTGSVVRKLGEKGEEGDDGWIDTASHLR